MRLNSRAKHLELVAVVAVVSLFAESASAQELTQFNNLATRIVQILQGIGVVVSAIGFITAGIKYNSGDPGAKEQAKNAVIGSALVAGAVVLAQFVKGFFA
jgi:hypothetical protein